MNDTKYTDAELLFSVYLNEGRSKEFWQDATRLSDFIDALPLSIKDRDKLISLIQTHMEEAEKNAFEQGYSKGKEDQ